MRRLYPFFILSAVLFMASCLDKYTETYNAYTLVYMPYQELRSAVKSGAPRSIEYPGKIYFKGTTLFVVEKQEGIHVIDVSDPKNPSNIRFVEIPGCADIAVKNNSLYVDSYVDLVVLDVSDLQNVKETTRIKDAFPYTVPPTEKNLRIDNVDKDKGVVIDWEIKKMTKDIEQASTVIYPTRPWSWYDKYGELSNGFSSDAGGSSGSSSASFGKSGSMARFGLYNDYLYAVDNNAIYLFNVANDSNPEKEASPQYVGSGIETMFIYDNHMFFGTSNGMLVYSLANPQKLQSVSSYWHITACDPVVVEDGYAYVTLRAGLTCRNESVNRLDVLKLSDDYKTIQSERMYNMTEPHGLGIENNILFLCDGKAGLKIYDATDKKKITDNQLAVFPTIQAYDVIPVNGYLFMIGSDGFYLYDYATLSDIKLIGKISVAKE